MFDIGFSELTIIAVVALLVIGPERLPEVARTVGSWVGKLRYFVNSVKTDINSQVKFDELQQELEKQAKLPDELFEMIDEKPVKKPSNGD